MTPVTVSSAQRHQHTFLLDQLGTHQALLWADNQWYCQPACLDKHSQGVRLTLWAQALTLHQLEQVMQALGSTLQVGAFTRQQYCGRFGETVLSAAVTVNDVASLPAQLADVFTFYGVEAAVVNQAPRLDSPGLLVMDMDSTLIAMECIDEIARLSGTGPQVAEVTAKAMRGELDFNTSLVSRVACLKDIKVASLEQIRDSMPLMPGVASLVNELKQHGWRLAIASGGFTYFADHLKQRLGLDAAFSNQLETADGRLTGKVTGSIVNGEEKACVVQYLASEYAITPGQVVAMGDGANDLPMMGKADLGVACHAKPVVNAQADVAIRRSGLHSLLYLLAS